MPGMVYTMCGSLASSGRPLAVRLPAITQEFEPCGDSPGVRAGDRNSTFCASPEASRTLLRNFACQFVVSL